jgi:hypothetical protein
MASNVFPVPSTSTTSLSTLINTITATTANTVYKGTVSMAPAVYTITVPSGTMTMTFIAADKSTSYTYTNSVTTGVTSNIAFTVDTIIYRHSANSGSATIQATGSPVSIAASGILDTLTTSQTYDRVGKYVYVCAVGGGAGGGAGTGNFGSFGAAGGSSGGVTNSEFFMTTPVSVTIGAAGNGGNTSAASGNGGGSTSFGNVTALGGTGGGGGGVNGGPGTANAPSGGGAGQANGGSGSASGSAVSWVKTGTTGGGGGGAYQNGVGGNGGGSGGIGTGGKGGDGSQSGGGLPNAGTGYGSGGGGGASWNTPVQPGREGTTGVVYVVYTT